MFTTCDLKIWKSSKKKSHCWALTVYTILNPVLSQNLMSIFPSDAFFITVMYHDGALSCVSPLPDCFCYKCRDNQRFTQGREHSCFPGAEGGQQSSSAGRSGFTEQGPGQDLLSSNGLLTETQLLSSCLARPWVSMSQSCTRVRAQTWEIPSLW